MGFDYLKRVIAATRVKAASGAAADDWRNGYLIEADKENQDVAHGI